MFGLSVLPLSPAPQLSLHLFAVAKCFYEFVSWLTSTLLIESNAKGKWANGKTKPTYCHNGRLMVIPGLVAISWSWWQSEASLLFAKTSCCSGCLSFSTSLFFFTFFFDNFKPTQIYIEKRCNPFVYMINFIAYAIIAVKCYFASSSAAGCIPLWISQNQRQRQTDAIMIINSHAVSNSLNNPLAR